MTEPYLQVTYRRGNPHVAYLYLPCEPGEKSCETELVEPEMVLDFNKDGKLIGIELVDPELVTLEEIKKVLQKHGLDCLKETDFPPILST